MHISLVLLAAAAASSPAPAQVADKSGYSLTNPTPREALRDLSTDRPDKTESPYTVDAGRVQVELDFVNFTRDRDRGSRAQTLSLLPVNFKLGITNSTDLQLLFDPRVRQRVKDRATGRSDSVTGVGDLTLRLKHNLWGNDGGGTALAVMPVVKLPTASNGIGNDAVEFGLIVPLAIAVSDRVGIGLMSEVDLLEQADGSGYAPSFIHSATVSFALGERLGVYSELFAERSTERGARWIVTADAGLTYRLSDDLQLDGGVNLGLTRAADDLQLFVGVSRRF